MAGPQTVHLITVHISCSQREFHLKKKNDLPIFKKPSMFCFFFFSCPLSGVIYLHTKSDVLRTSKLFLEDASLSFSPLSNSYR